MTSRINQLNFHINNNRTWDSKWFSKNNYKYNLIEDLNIRKIVIPKTVKNAIRFNKNVKLIYLLIIDIVYSLFAILLVFPHIYSLFYLGSTLYIVEQVLQVRLYSLRYNFRIS